MIQAVRKQSTETLERPVVTVRSLMAMLITLVLLVLIGYVGQSLTRATSFPIKKVAVEGDFRHLTPSYIQTLVSNAVRGGFFQIDVQAIRRGLLEEPWVMDAQVERRWPDAIRVVISEQRPAARWGRSALLNTAADVFAPRLGSFPRDLPQLSGPVGSELEVLGTFRAVADHVRPMGLKVVAVDLSERGAWIVGLNGETRLLLGRNRLEERLARFRLAYDLSLHETWPAVLSVDLRYTNGFAIQERTPETRELREDKKGG